MSRHTTSANAWLAQADGVRHNAVRDLMQQAIAAPSPADRLQQYRSRMRDDESSWDFMGRIVRGLRIVAAMHARKQRVATHADATVAACKHHQLHRRLRVVGGSRKG